MGGLKKKEENKKPLWMQNPTPGLGSALGSGIEPLSVPSRVGNSLADRKASNSPPAKINNIGLPMTGMKEEEIESEASIKEGSYDKKITSGNEWGVEESVKSESVEPSPIV